eukprot:1414267-Amphidinium_carterae.1
MDVIANWQSCLVFLRFVDSMTFDPKEVSAMFQVPRTYRFLRKRSPPGARPNYKGHNLHACVACLRLAGHSLPWKRNQRTFPPTAHV